jgi:hypothetical protein
MLVEIAEIYVQHVVLKPMLLILFGFVWIARENTIQNAHVVVILKEDKLEQVKYAILVTR